MKTEQEYFEEGQTIQEYMDNMSKLKEESFQVYENFKLPDDGFAEQLKDFSLFDYHGRLVWRCDDD